MTTAVHESVKVYYGTVLRSNADLRTNACCAKPPPPYIKKILSAVPVPVKEKFYGCGSPFPEGIRGLNVLDLGCGSGQDCYVASALVGPEGFVTGIDMTEQQLSVARGHMDEFLDTLKYPKSNVRFVQGYIEHLEEAGIVPNSVDLVISNCVVNLCPDKLRVLQQVFKVLKHGGEFFFSDVFASRRLPAAVQEDPVALGECLAGALYLPDFRHLCREAGFLDSRIYSSHRISVENQALNSTMGGAEFTSITFRLFKLEHSLESSCEDYGQVAVYQGTIEACPMVFVLDKDHAFETNRPVLVCGNTAAILAESWMRNHFHVTGRANHFGPFQRERSTVTASGVTCTDEKNCGC